MQPLSSCLLLGAIACTSVSALGQTIVLTDSSPYTQNFDGLSAQAGSTTNNLALPGWYMTETGGEAPSRPQPKVIVLPSLEEMAAGNKQLKNEAWQTLQGVRP